MLVRVVADVDGSRAVAGELVGGGAADADGGVGAFDELGLVGVVLGCLVDGRAFRGEDGPVTMTTLPLTLLGCVRTVLLERQRGTAYGLAESPATRRILGMFSNVPGSSMGAESCALSCCSRCFGTDVMMCFFSKAGVLS